jgi:hypothetical protein
MCKSIVRKRLVLLSFSVVLVGVLGGVPVATGNAKKVQAHAASTTSFGPSSPTFVGPAATGCASGCSLLTGPFTTTSTASSSSTSNAPAVLNSPARWGGAHAMPGPTAAGIAERSHIVRSHARASAHVAAAPTPVIPNVRCHPIGLGCDTISTAKGGATGVKGLDAVDSASLSTNSSALDIEPPDQGLCAGNGDVVETNNIGEILVFNTALKRLSTPIPLDTVMGLTSRAWSSGGDPSCEYDSSNGGHWFFTEIVSASSEANQGAFTGCFAAVSNTCYEGIAVSQGSNPLGPYYVYYLNANYNPAEPGSPNLLNDFAKIGVTRDAFLLFYDEFPLLGNGVGGGAFNGAQEFAFDKNALEHGRRVTLAGGVPNPNFNVAIENMGQIPTPDGTCAGTSPSTAGIDCWSAVIPGQPADAGQEDNHYGGTGFMVSALDFESFFGNPSAGDNRVAVWDWTGLSNLNSSGCHSCSGVNFGGQVFTGQEPYYGPENIFGVGNLSPQKAGPIPLGDECTAVGAPSQPCPEGGINPNADNMTQVSQGQGQLWSALVTEVRQIFASSAEIHNGAAYWVIDTNSFDKTGLFTMTDQGYVSAAHEDMEMPAIAAEGTGGNGKAIMLFTLNGNGGPTGADNGGFYPSTAYGRLTSTSNGLTGSAINIADAGQSPQDGFSEYQPFPSPGNPPRPRWGDYSWGIYLPGGSDRLYFATEYIQSPNCTGSAFTLTIGTCGGTRDGLANWGTSVNYVVP